MGDYTPTTEKVRGIWLDAMTQTSEYFDALSPAEARARFDRWLEAHDHEVAAKALREACQALPFPQDPYGGFDHESLRAAQVQHGNWLRARADSLRAEREGR